jgi:hypothetical protein
MIKRDGVCPAERRLFARQREQEFELVDGCVLATTAALIEISIGDRYLDGSLAMRLVLRCCGRFFGSKEAI